MTIQSNFNLVYVLNGLGFSSGMPIGGADKRALEVGRYLEESGVAVTVLTTDAGRVILEKWSWPAKVIEIVRPSFWPKALENGVLGRVLAYFYSILADLFLVYKLPATNYELIIYPTSDMFFDILPALFLKLKFRKAKLVGIVHHWIPNPLSRGGFSFSNLALFIAQRAGFYFLRTAADRIFVPKTQEGEKIRKVMSNLGVSQNRIFSFKNGVNIEEIAKAPETEKFYEACFLGGFRPSKGIFDIVPVWQKVRQHLSEAKLLVIGGGMEKYKKELENRIKEAGLSDSIILAGVVNQSELYKTMKTARILLSPSHEEGWGIAVLEALACGLPVVAYDLPAYTVFKEAVVRVKLGEKDKLAEKVVSLLCSAEVFEKQKR
ncbi:MAG: glycosyltransferase family 4 protein, partial [Patescibacteria group bacterium]